MYALIAAAFQLQFDSVLFGGGSLLLAIDIDFKHFGYSDMCHCCQID